MPGFAAALTGRVKVCDMVPTASTSDAPRNKRDDDVSGLKSERLVIKWMMGCVAAFQVVIFAKLFMH